MSYWDTSALVKLYVEEADSLDFERLLVPQSVLVTSRITAFEACATFHRKENEGALRPGSAEKLFNQFLEDIHSGQIRLIPIDFLVDSRIGALYEKCFGFKPPIPIRTLDAIHLVCAEISGEKEIITTDKRMRQAARQLGFVLFPVME
jgi:predicted nucleic acid-binding protein